MSNEYPEVKLNPSIHHGNATVVGTEKGWMIPGGREVRSEATAKMMAIRMSKLMKGLDL